jgi:hypothetical protein
MLGTNGFLKQAISELLDRNGFWNARRALDDGQEARGVVEDVGLERISGHHGD